MRPYGCWGSTAADAGDVAGVFFEGGGQGVVERQAAADGHVVVGAALEGEGGLGGGGRVPRRTRRDAAEILRPRDVPVSLRAHPHGARAQLHHGRRGGALSPRPLYDDIPVLDRLALGGADDGAELGADLALTGGAHLVVVQSGAWINGYMLNNSGYDFSNHETEEDWESDHPYRIRSSTISPTIILDQTDEVRLVIGAPGGGRIPTAILQNIIYILEYELDPLEAVTMPRIFPDRSSAKVEIENGFDLNVLREIHEMGYDIQKLSGGYARIYLVSKEDGKLIGVADPRHNGEVRGY